MRQKRTCPAAAAGVLSALVLLAGFAWYENRTIQTEVFRLRAPALPRAFSSLRVVQISDLHGEVFGEYSRSLIDAVRAAKPDLIAITGDLADEFTDFSMLRPLVSGLRAIAPAFYVTGNHEWVLSREKRQQVFDILDECGVVRLQNEYRVLKKDGETMVLAGVDDPNGPYDQKTPEHLVAEIRRTCGEGAYILMLSHRNDQIEMWAQLGVDAVLCGHAHGGVVRLPVLGGVFGTRYDLFPAYTAGVYTQGKTQVLVSRGLGRSHRVPLRICNRPQLVVAILEREENT